MNGDRRSTATASEGASLSDGLIVVFGLPGVGKTTVARRIADRTDATLLRTDVVRKSLFSPPEYTDAETETVYDELLSRAGRALDEGETVVLDATFAESAFREDARAVADERDVPIQFVNVECNSAIVEERIQRRAGVSDADFEVHRTIREEFDPIDVDHVTIDNSGPMTATFDQVDDLF